MVAERNGTQSQETAAGVGHALNVFLEAYGGIDGAELAVGINHNGNTVGQPGSAYLIDSNGGRDRTRTCDLLRLNLNPQPSKQNKTH